MANLKLVFDRLRSAHMKLKPKKCNLFRRRVEYLGHIIDEEGIRPCEEKVEAVKNWPEPSCLYDVRAFLGLASYYRRFIPNFSETAAAMINLTRKDVKFFWGVEAQQSFEHLKRILTLSLIHI